MRSGTANTSAGSVTAPTAFPVRRSRSGSVGAAAAAVARGVAASTAARPPPARVCMDGGKERQREKSPLFLVFLPAARGGKARAEPRTRKAARPVAAGADDASAGRARRSASRAAANIVDGKARVRGRGQAGYGRTPLSDQTSRLPLRLARRL